MENQTNFKENNNLNLFTTKTMNSLNNNLKFIININKRFLKGNRLFSMQRIVFYPNFKF